MIITVSNLKGGVAKTVTVANLACCLAQAGKRVLAVDTDGQCNLTQYIDAVDRKAPSIADALLGSTPIGQIIRRTAFGVDLVPCNFRFLGAELAIFRKYGQDCEGLLSALLEPVRADYDYVLIDCPPALGIITTNAIFAADHIIVPFMADAFGVDALFQMFDLLQSVDDGYGVDIANTTVLFTQYSRTRTFDAMIEEVGAMQGARCFQTKIRRCADVPTSTLRSTPVVVLRPRCNASKDYVELAKEVMRLGD